MDFLSELLRGLIYRAGGKIRNCVLIQNEGLRARCDACMGVGHAKAHYKYFPSDLLRRYSPPPQNFAQAIPVTGFCSRGQRSESISRRNWSQNDMESDLRSPVACLLYTRITRVHCWGFWVQLSNSPRCCGGQGKGSGPDDIASQRRPIRHLREAGALTASVVNRSEPWARLLSAETLDGDKYKKWPARWVNIATITFTVRWV